jgi:hypothetical protein
LAHTGRDRGRTPRQPGDSPALDITRSAGRHKAPAGASCSSDGPSWTGCSPSPSGTVAVNSALSSPPSYELRSSLKLDLKASASTRWPLRFSPAASTGARGIAVDRSPSSHDAHTAAPRATVASFGLWRNSRAKLAMVSHLANLRAAQHGGESPAFRSTHYFCNRTGAANRCGVAVPAGRPLRQRRCVLHDRGELTGPGTSLT